MRLKFLSITGILFLAITFIIASCSKDGPAGPAGVAGPQGAPGANGAAGPAGPAGAAGTIGTANVVYSDWLNVTFDPASADSSVWSADIPAPKLVDSILTKGDIKVFWNLGSDSTNDQFIVPLPVVDVLLFGGLLTVNSYSSFQNILLLSNFDLSSFKTGIYNNFQFRYILIPGGVKAGKGVKTIDWNNYKEVQQYLGIKD